MFLLYVISSPFLFIAFLLSQATGDYLCLDRDLGLRTLACVNLACKGGFFFLSLLSFFFKLASVEKFGVGFHWALVSFVFFLVRGASAYGWVGVVCCLGSRRKFVGR